MEILKYCIKFFIGLTLVIIIPLGIFMVEAYSKIKGEE